MWLQPFIFILLFIGLTPLIGGYMMRVFTGNARIAKAALGWLEALCYKIGGVDPNKEMTAAEYGKSLFIFNFLGFSALFLLVLFQGILPLNLQGFPGVSWDLAFNIAASFVTNANLQTYAGESTLSTLSQMLGLTTLNFLSAATGMAALLCLARGVASKLKQTVGNFWVDLVRMLVYVLLPLSIPFALFLIFEGVPQTFSSPIEAVTLEGEAQTIPVGLVASQEAIKQIGTNGGGFFNVNSAHPFENPTGLANFFELLAIIVIPAACVYMYGAIIGFKKHAWLLFFAMFSFWCVGLFFSLISEEAFNPAIGAFPAVEGVETRLGLGSSFLWTISTTATSNGSVNSMISSLPPLVGGVALFNMMLGELIFGGIGVGLCSMIMLTLLTMFLAGLMMGRSPEYLGKKLEKREIQLVMLAILTPSILTLGGAGISFMLSEALSGISETGPHRLSEVLYAFASAAGNDGSSFAGFNLNTTYYNLFLGVIMLVARIAIIWPSIAIAGILAKKNASGSAGSMHADTFLFFLLLIIVIFVMGALTFFPALSLGPIAEHFLMLDGRLF